MADNWVEEFGFTKNPYVTKALSNQEGVMLLYGRNEEQNWLVQQLVANNTIPLLVGDNGVGKTSIANVVAFKLSQKYQYDRNKRYLYLSLSCMPSTSLDYIDSFERYLP